MSGEKRAFKTFKEQEDDGNINDHSSSKRLHGAEPNPFRRQSRLRVTLSEKVTYFTRKGRSIRQRTVVGSPSRLVKKAPVVPGLEKFRMENKGGESDQETFDDWSEDEEEGKLDKRKSVSDPNLLSASLQMKNASGLFAGNKGKPTVPKKPLLLTTSPPAQRSKRWKKKQKNDLWCQIPDLGDDSQTDSKGKKKSSGKKGKPGSSPKADEIDEKDKNSAAKTKDNVKQKGNIFSRLRGKSDSESGPDMDSSKQWLFARIFFRKKEEDIKENTDESTTDDKKDTAKDSEPEKAGKFANIKGLRPPRPTPPATKSAVSAPKPKVVPPPKPTSPPPKPKVPPPPVPTTTDNSTEKSETESTPEAAPKKKPVIYEDVPDPDASEEKSQTEPKAESAAKKEEVIYEEVKARGKESKDGDKPTDSGNTDKEKPVYEEIGNAGEGDASEDSSDDEPIADPDDFNSSSEDDKPQIAEPRFKIQDIVLPLEVNEQEIEFDDEARKVAYELLITEKKYVNRLFLVDQVFHFRLDIENRARNWFSPEVVQEMFANVKSIYQFHRDFLLPKLEQRLANWESNPKIGDLMKDFAPFFRMYSEYVKNFDHAMELLNSWMVKQPDFADLVRAIQTDKACGNLSLPHHMLEPVQRIPRYELLLKEYLKCLPEGAEDRADTQTALGLISTAAQSSMEAMKKIEKFKNLLELQSTIEGSKEIIVPGRELLKEGKIIKRSARRGEAQDRYLFLFNDILLCCSIHKKLVTTTGKYRVRAKLDVKGMQVANVNTESSTCSFHVSSKQKVMEFQATSEEHRTEWVEAIQETIKEYNRKKKNFRETEENVNSLGKRAPKWVRDDCTTQCMRCAAEFHSFKRRRHHCRACGLVVCDKCSTYRVKLAYDDQKGLHRVCVECYKLLGFMRQKSEDDSADKNDVQDENVDGEETTATDKDKKEMEKVKEEEEEEVIDFSGHLHQCTSDKLYVGKKVWVKRWIVISSLALHFYKAHQDINPFLSLPLSCFKAQTVTEDDGIERPHAFKVTYKKNIYYLAADKEETKDEWMEMIKKYGTLSPS